MTDSAAHDANSDWPTLALSTIDAPIAVFDEAGCIRYFNPACERITGWTSAEVVGRVYWDVLVPADEREARRLAHEALLHAAEPSGEEFDWVDRDGARHHISWRLAPLASPERGVIATGLDLTDLVESEARYRWLSAATIEGITVHDRGVIVDVNRRCAEIFGFEEHEMIGRSVLDFATPESRETIMSRIRQGLEGGYEVTGLRKDGSTFPLEIVTRLSTFRGEPLRIAGLRDISDRKRLEQEHRASIEQLHRAQRLDSVGALAGGIAHDFNNLLSVMLGCTELAMRKHGQIAGLRDDLQKVIDAANLAAKLTRQLLVFSRQEALDARPLDVNNAIEAIAPLVRRALRDDILLEMHLGERLAAVRLAESQLEQVLINLALNARDAMPSGGRIRIETAAHTVDEPGQLTSGAIEPGSYLRLRVADDGVGIAAEVAERMFEPFFSTKPHAGGSGLGLAVVYGVVTGAGGAIDVTTRLGAGTTIDMLLPICSELPSDTVADPLATDGPSVKILVVEDQEALLAVMTRILQEGGHEVLSAKSGAEALDLLDGAGPTIDLLVSDVIMPGMSGPELASRLRATHPAMRVIFVSGYADDVLDGYASEQFHFLAKPFTPDQLLTTVATSLRGDDRATAR